MKRTSMEPVTRTYCDVCGKDVTRESHTGQNGKDYCSEHTPWSYNDIRREHAIERILEQPYVGEK